jgi:hypothetical protein
VEFPTLAEHAEDARRKLAGRLDLKTASAGEIFHFAAIEAVHAVAIGQRVELPNALQASNVLVRGPQDFRRLAARDSRPTSGATVDHAGTPARLKYDLESPRKTSPSREYTVRVQVLARALSIV